MTAQPVYILCAVADLPSRKARSFHLLRTDPNGRHEPWPVVIVRWGKHVFGYVNRCPHHGGGLDWERGQFFDPNGTRLMCGKHGAEFELATGRCVNGPCLGESLEPVAVFILGDDICITGVTLAEDASGA